MARIRTAPEIAVVGSVNIDLVVPVDRLPLRGETVSGRDLRRGAGGKGANQAVAAARLGRRVAFIGAVGADDGGTWLADQLGAAGVETHLVVAPGPSGHAVVFVEPDGESSIVVSPGANGRLSSADIEARAEVVRSAGAVLLQHEVDDSVVGMAARLAEGLVVLNPAPGRPVPADVLGRVDVLVPNRTELAILAGIDVPRDLESVLAAARSLPVSTVITTLGAAGALVVTGEGHEHVPALRVEPVDTTAAGDSFCAALADALLGGADPVEAAGWATRVAGVTVTRPGAQDSLPSRAEVDNFGARIRKP